MTSTHGNHYPGAFPQGPKAIYSGNLGKRSTQIVPRLLERCHHGLLAWSTVGLGSQWRPGQCQLTAGPLAHLFSHFFGLDFPWISSGKEFVCTAGDLGLILGLGRSPWRRERLSTPVFWPGEFHGLYSAWGRKELGMTERLSLHFKNRYLWTQCRVLLVPYPLAGKHSTNIQACSSGFMARKAKWRVSLANCWSVGR